MTIPINPPLTVPAKSFDIWFYTRFAVTEVTPTGGALLFTKVPLSSTTGELYHEAAETVQVNLWDAVANVPEAAAALQCVLDALPAIENWKNNQ